MVVPDQHGDQEGPQFATAGEKGDVPRMSMTSTVNHCEYYHVICALQVSFGSGMLLLVGYSRNQTPLRSLLPSLVCNTVGSWEPWWGSHMTTPLSSTA